MADFYSVKDDAARLVIQLCTEIELFFVLGSLLLLLDVYLYRGSNMHYSLLTFDWSTQHGFNIGAIVGFFVAFSFVMTVVTPLLLVVVNFIMALSWRKIDLFKDKEQDREKWRAPNGYVPASQLRESAYNNQKLYLLDRLDKHYAAKAADDNKQLARLAAGSVVTIFINAAFGYSGRGTVVWHLFN